MNQDGTNSRRLREGGLAFFGAINASLSHQINNVLAIVSELSGLLGDLSHGAASGRPLDPERLISLSGRIGEQVDRGKRLVKRLNRFAHSVDQPVTAVDLAETFELITTLCQRFADLKKATLEAEIPDQSLVVESSAFGLMQAVHLCLDLALKAGTEGSNTITAGCRPAEDGCELTVTCTDEIPLDPYAVDRLSYLTLLMDDLGGRIVSTPETDPRRLVLYIPRKHHRATAD